MKTIVFDFDGTLTKKSHEIWYKMWESLDALDIDDVLFHQYKNKEIDYITWCERIEEEYKKRGFNKEMLFRISSNIELMDNLEQTLRTLKENGYDLYIVSGGVDKVIYDKLGNLSEFFSGIYACIFEFDKDGNLSRIIPTKYDEDGKRIFINEYCIKTNTNPKEITFIGNGDNDEYVYLSGCNTICINPKENVNHDDSNIWHKVIYNSQNMLDILKYFNLEKEAVKRRGS